MTITGIDAFCAGVGKSTYAGECPGAVVDAQLAAELYADNRSVVQGMLDDDCTRGNIMQAIDETVRRPVDRLGVIDFSGHATQQPDRDGDEADGLDEALCGYDGIITDDEIHEILQGAPAGKPIFLNIDACHSGTMARGSAIPNAIIPVTFRRALRADDITAQVICFSGCPDDAYSFGSDDGGVWHAAMLDAWESRLALVRGVEMPIGEVARAVVELRRYAHGERGFLLNFLYWLRALRQEGAAVDEEIAVATGETPLTWREWFDESKALVNPRQQVPQYSEYGPVTDEFRHGTALKIQTERMP
jgi:hypothetical protein